MQLSPAVRWLSVVVLSLLVSVAARAEQTPHQVVEGVTADVLQVVQDKKALPDEQPEVFYQAVSEVLSPVIAFDYIARGVMGRYAKQATPEQRQRFTEAFQSDLINTYAKGMAAFGEERIEVLPPEGDIAGQKRVSVVQKVYTADGENIVSYTMGKSKKTNEWKLLNVVINGVNLGQTFRSQFAQAMQEAGDLEQVITDWSAQS
ncbi:MlaC/ttg2D family ABC transporter substrate-binding protein [Candidatus Pelagadaptatus aseana]|uniref:MlaC/ttg2D family ABC transporter substrate-binding protein n=1 Tax=Candidatus Pelagadaptatus aseana TaxID=3120508 RepID=UPI003C6FECBD